MSGFFSRLWSRPGKTAAPKASGLKLVEAADLTREARVLLAGQGFAGRDVRVFWNMSLRSTAGLARYADLVVFLNPRLRAISDEEVRRTFLHELAHLLAKLRHPHRRIAAHGAEWKTACADLGIPDEKRCHDLPLPRTRRARPYVYQCRNCRIEVARTRPFKRSSACAACCKLHNRGKYDERFLLVRVTRSSAP